MNFLPVSILAYALNGGALLVDKILLRSTLPKPLIYTFYISLLQLLVLALIPFGFSFAFEPATYLAVLSGLVSVAALYTMFVSLKENEASIVGPLVGMANPLFALLLGTLFLNQVLTSSQYLAFLILIAGAVLLTFNLWFSRLKFGRKFLWILSSGFLFGLSYVLLREAFLQTSFLNGLIISRASAGFLALTFLFSHSLRKQIFSSQKSDSYSKTTLSLLILGQTMGAGSGLLITLGVSLASPALVNACFGVQYLVILIASIILLQQKPNLLDETLSKGVIFQKILGAGILSLGLYLLAR